MARGIPPQSLQTSSRALELELELELMARCSHTPPRPSARVAVGFFPSPALGLVHRPRTTRRLASTTTTQLTLAWRQPASASTASPVRSPKHSSDLSSYTSAYGQTSPRRVRGTEYEQR
ncbi:hypothetical protein V8C44DRAFT_320448 [Trichoderma aethiopicum]